MFEQSVTVILATLAIFFAQSFYIVREILITCYFRGFWEICRPNIVGEILITCYFRGFWEICRPLEGLLGKLTAFAVNRQN